MTVLEWLLDSDPSIRWQTLRDLCDAPGEVVRAERARVAAEGWGARLLVLQGDDGLWKGGALFPGRNGQPIPWGESEGQPWTATAYSLVQLQEFGVDPDDDRVRQAVALVRDNCRWENAGQPFFEGEVEPCINGMVVSLGAYFGQDVDAVVDRLVGEQLEDGGWNCEVENGSVRGSFGTTIRVLEGLLEHEQQPVDQRTPAPPGKEERSTCSNGGSSGRKSTGEVIDPEFLQFSYPTRWHYDVLRGLDYFRSTGSEPDARVGEAIELVRSKQQPDGTWLLENTHKGAVHFAMDAGDGQPSRWNTLRAMRVLRWSDR